MDLAIQYPWFRRSLTSFYPSRLFDQFFGEGPFDYDLFPIFSSTISPYYRLPVFRNFLDSGISEVRSERDRFMINLNVKHFLPEELSVKIVDDFVEIHGKHTERQEDQGRVSREFRRIYHLPSNSDQANVTCSLSNDGLLTLCCPKIRTGDDSNQQDRPIPVTREEKLGSQPEIRADP
ncbi:alpha-crystallin A chain [Carcharodon carcharias]|uniref:alpha-crystallin A chain n=1 Tax=Carcharodon carcharias TaxID=13397 RepID=UPI001B7E4A5B|nr:alpha-crystallin A chain [Carcharodon carcharias]